MSNRNATVTVNTKANTSGIKQATESLRSMDSGLKGSIGNLKQFGGALKGLALVGIAKGIKDFTDKVHESYVTQALAEKSINDSLYSNMTARGESQANIDKEVKAYKELASQLQTVGVIGDEVTLSGMGVMTQMGLTANQVKGMTPLLQDLSVKQYGLNVSSEQYKEVSQSVATMVNMGKLGLQKYGIQVSDVERKQFKAMTQTERYNFIMGKLKNSVAGANEAMAKTSSGKIVQMNNNIGDSYEKIGETVDKIYNSIATTALPVVNDFTFSLQEFFDIINGNIESGSLKFFSEEDMNNILGVRDGLKEIASTISNLYSQSTDFGTSFGFTSTLLWTLNEVVYLLKEACDLANTINEATGGMIGKALSIASPIVRPALPPIGKNATGTNYFEGGLTHVNENGGEIMNLPNGTQIIPHDVSQKMSGGGNNVTVNLNISGNVIDNNDFINQIGETISNRVSLAISNM